MEVLPTAINAVVVVAVGLILGRLGKGRIDNLEARIDGRIDRLEERMDARFDSMRSDLTRIALAVGVRPEAEAGGS